MSTNPTVNEILRDARAMLRDLLYDWPISELHRSPDEVIAEITYILDDGYNPETGDTDEP